LYEVPVFRGMWFTYPPFAALLFTPFALLPAVVGKATFVAANIILVMFVAGRSWRSVTGLRGGMFVAAVVAITSAILLTEAVHASVYVGQINLVLLALVVADLTGRDDSPMRGVGVGIAAGIKLTPLIFVAYLLVVRRFRAAMVAAGCFGGTVLLAFALLPRDSVRYWLNGTFADPSRIYPDLRSTHNQSLHGLVLRSGLADKWVPWVWGALAVAVGVVALVIAAQATRRGQRLLAITLCGACATAVSPWSWGHHWVWILPLAVVVAHRVIVSAGSTPWLVIGLLLPLTFYRVLALADPPDGRGPAVLTSGPAALFLDNLYLLIFLATLIVTALDRQADAPCLRTGRDPVRRTWTQVGGT
jgi:alpha-1,2-mannosyltransferase